MNERRNAREAAMNEFLNDDAARPTQPSREGGRPATPPSEPSTQRTPERPAPRPRQGGRPATRPSEPSAPATAKPGNAAEDRPEAVGPDTVDTARQPVVRGGDGRVGCGGRDEHS